MNQFLCWPKNHPVHVTIMWLNLKYHITWPSTIYRTLSVQLYPQPMSLVDWSEISWLCSIEVNLAIRWPLKCMSATLWLEGFTLMSAALPQATWWVPEWAHTWGSTPLPRKVMCGAVNNALQLIILLNLNVIIWKVSIMPKKESHEAAEEP